MMNLIENGLLKKCSGMLLGALCCLLATPLTFAQIIDDFTISSRLVVRNTEQPDNHPINSIDKAVQTGPTAKIIGGERELAVEISSGPGSIQSFVNGQDAFLDYSSGPTSNGVLTVTWDGSGSPGDGLATDLRAQGGDTFQIIIDRNEPHILPVALTIEGETWSDLAPSTLTIPGPITFNIPFSRFPSVDFSRVDSIQLAVDANNLSDQDFRLALFRVVDTIPTSLRAIQTGVPISDGCFNAGDLIEYTIEIINDGPDYATNIVFTDTPDPNTTVVANSINTSHGQDASNGNDIQVNIGELAPGARAIVRFQVTVNAGVAADTALINNGEVNGFGLDPLSLTPTQINVQDCTSALSVVKTSTQIDNGCFAENDTIVYEIIVTNGGTTTLSGLVLNDVVDANLSVVAGSVSTIQGNDETVANNVQVNIGSLSPGLSASITFQATVNQSVAADTVITNQASISAIGIDTVVSNQVSNTIEQCAPSTPVQPPETGDPLLTATKISSVEACFGPGHNVAYGIVISNIGGASASDVIITDTVDGNTSILPSTLSNTHGTVNADANELQAAIANLAPGDSATILFKAEVANGVPTGTIIRNEATASATGLAAISTNQVANTVRDCPTDKVVPVLQSVMISSDSCLNPGDSLAYQAVITNTSNAPVSGIVFTGTPDPNTTLVNDPIRTTQGTVVSGTSNGDNIVVVDIGTLAPFASTTISYEVKLSSDVAVGTLLTHQGIVDSNELSQEISTTSLPVGFCGTPPTPMPTLSEWAMLLMILILVAASWRQRRVLLNH